MLKANGEYRTAFKYFQLALLDAALSSFSDLQGMLFLKLKILYDSIFFVSVNILY